MKISLIAAMTKSRVIGKENAMPWHLPADFAWFKQCTLGKPIIMGRKTYDSIGRALPGRTNIVISRDPELSIADVHVVNSLEAALALVATVPEVMIIGGGAIFEQSLARAERLYLTQIAADLEGDTYFPDWGSQWQVIHQAHYAADVNNAYSMDFLILEKTEIERKIK